MKISYTISGIILFVFLYFFFIYTTKTPEDDIESLTDEEKKQYKKLDKKLTPHEQDVLKHPDYWGNPLNEYFYNLFNK